MRIDACSTTLCDLGGCLVSGDSVLPGAHALVRHAGEKLFILSDTSTDTPQSLRSRLSHLGLFIPPTRILLAGMIALERIGVPYPGARVCIFAETHQNVRNDLPVSRR